MEGLFLTKKKKKKKEKKDCILDNLEENDNDYLGLLNLAEDIKNNTSSKKDKIEFDSKSFMNGEGSKKKKHKELVKKYENMFKDEKTKMSALLKEAEKDSSVIRSAFLSITENGSVRGVMGKVATDFASALISSNTHRLNILKQLADITKIANDLAFKEESKIKVNDENLLDQESLGAMALKSLFSQSSKDFNNELQENTSISLDEYNKIYKNEFNDKSYSDIDTSSPVDESGNTKEVIYKQKDSVPFDKDMDNHMNNLNQQYKDDLIYGRSAAGDSLIKNESKNVKIKIRRWSNEDTGKYEYDFVAIDRDDNIIDDYDLPDKDKLKISWNESTGYATDHTGRSYEVINY